MSDLFVRHFRLASAKGESTKPRDNARTRLPFTSFRYVLVWFFTYVCRWRAGRFFSYEVSLLLSAEHVGAPASVIIHASSSPGLLYHAFFSLFTSSFSRKFKTGHVDRNVCPSSPARHEHKCFWGSWPIHVHAPACCESRTPPFVLYLYHLE